MGKPYTYWISSAAPSVRAADRLGLYLLFAIGAGLTVVFGMFWFSSSYDSVVLFTVFTIMFWYLLSRVLFTWFVYSRIDEQAPAGEALTDIVAIFTTSYAGEPLEMVRKTLEACSKVTHPHRTYLLDNTGDPAFRQAAEELGAVWMDMNGVKGAKAGKINAALRQTDEPYVLVLDPDHFPMPGFFEETLGYFRDPEVGFVQVSQGYYNQQRSFVANGAAEQTYLFYGPVQQAYSNMGAAVAIGANCVFRREAFDSIGGHVIGLAEDLQTSLRLHSAGWKSVYNPVIVNRGLVPEDFDAFAKQQLKWARGAMEVLVEDLPNLFGKLNFQQKLIYLSIATFYFEGAVSFFFVLFPFFYFATDMVPVNLPVAHFAFFAAGYLLIGLLEYVLASRFVCHPSERYFHWRASLLKFACWPIYFYAFLLFVLRKKVPYIPTSKKVGTDWPVLIRPHFVYLGLFVAGVTSSVAARVLTPEMYSNPAVWWCMVVFSALSGIMSLLSIWFARPPKHLADAPDPWEEVNLNFKQVCVAKSDTAETFSNIEPDKNLID